MTDSWHISSEHLDNYLADRVDQPTASSIEAHLVGCARCRDALAERTDATQLAQSWESLERAIDGSLGSPIERVASRAGISDRDIRTLAPTLSLRLAWMAGTLLALLIAAWIAGRTGGAGNGLGRVVFLTIAPLAPFAAVVTALSAASEPLPEIAQVAPESRLRIGAIRATTVMLTAIVLGLAVSALLPGDWIDSVVWLLPAIALSGLGALIAGRVASTTVISIVGSTWIVVVTLAARLTDDRLAAFRPGAQVAYLAVAFIALTAFTVRPTLLDLRSQP